MAYLSLIPQNSVERFSQQNALDQDVWEFTDNVHYYMKDHTITAGTHNELVSFDNLYIQDFYGAYEFDGSNDYVNIAADSSLEMDYAVTYSLWVYPIENKSAEILHQNWGSPIRLEYVRVCPSCTPSSVNTLGL